MVAADASLNHSISSKAQTRLSQGHQPFFSHTYHTKAQQKSSAYPMTFIIVDKLFRVPLIVSTCLLAMAHGSNEVNVSAPSAAMIFLLNQNKTIGDAEAYAGMAIGLASLVLGVLTLGKRYLHKYRKKFMKTTLAKYVTTSI